MFDERRCLCSCFLFVLCSCESNCLAVVCLVGVMGDAFCVFTIIACEHDGVLDPETAQHSTICHQDKTLPSNT